MEGLTFTQLQENNAKLVAENYALAERLKKAEARLAACRGVKKSWQERAWAAEEKLQGVEAQIAEVEESLNSALITVARYAGPDAAPPVPFVVKLPDPYYGDRHCLDKREVIEAIKAANGSVAE